MLEKVFGNSSGNWIQQCEGAEDSSIKHFSKRVTDNEWEEGNEAVLLSEP